MATRLRPISGDAVSSRRVDRFVRLARPGGLVERHSTQPDGIFVQAKPDPVTWFLNGDDDIRSSYALEDVASEFDTQGLELDWAGLCWDANLRWTPDGWDLKRFRGIKWQNIKKEADRRYLLNAYRVNLTRARQGLVIFVPGGDARDVTRLPEYYDRTAAFLADCGITEVGLP